MLESTALCSAIVSIPRLFDFAKTKPCPVSPLVGYRCCPRHLHSPTGAPFDYFGTRGPAGARSQKCATCKRTMRTICVVPADSSRRYWGSSSELIARVFKCARAGPVYIAETTPLPFFNRKPADHMISHPILSASFFRRRRITR